MILNLLSWTLLLSILTLSCRGDVLSYLVEDLEELRVIPGPKGTLLINITTSVKLKCVKGMTSSLGSRVITSLDNKKKVLCDTETDGGGWIIIQRRVNGQENFTRNWNDYKNGFGSLDGDFWVGNELISNITSKEIYTLRIDMREGSNAYRAEYDSFMVNGELDKYRLHLGVFTGNTRDSLRENDNKPFSTSDRDNDDWDSSNCGQVEKSGWWFWFCSFSNLNGVRDLHATGGICWYDGRDWKYMDFVEMKIRLK